MQAAIFSCLVYLFVAAGVTWQTLHPRGLVARFRIWALVFTLAAGVGFLPATTLDLNNLAGVAMLLGLPIGVVLAAWWSEERERFG